MKIALLLVITLCFLPVLAGPVHGGDVAVIKSSGAGVYNESLEGFRETLRHRVVAEYDIKGDFERGRKALEKLQSTVNPNLLFTLGTPALRVASRKKTSLPAVYSMVFNPDSIIGTEVKNITGVSMNVSVKETIQLLKELSPKVQRVGVVFNPASSGNLVIQALPVARKRGIQLVTRQIRAANQAIQAVNSLRGKIDVLWIVPDETIVADEVFKYMLLFSYQNKVPVLGLSEKQTEMGALLSLSYRSSNDMGRQAGDMANRILSGINPAKIPGTTSRQVKLNVNLRAARKLKVKVPDSLIAKADNAVQAPVYKEGDWWVFRVKRGDETPEDYRITYENGEFQGDDPLFLAENFPPLASLHLNHSEIKNFNFPLIPGKKWRFRYSRETFGIYRTSTHFYWQDFRNADAEVIGPMSEFVETPAGKFKVIEIRRSERQPFVETVYYYSPESKSVVKLTVDLPDARAMGEAIDRIELELINYGHKKTIVQAPVYQNGDWWVYRVKRGNESPEEYRITYENGYFQGGDDAPLILTNGPPLASVYSNHPIIENFNFPLVTGKKWTYRYSRIDYGFLGKSPYATEQDKMGNAEVEVIGPVSDPILTPAGKFKVIEIRRSTDASFTRGEEDPSTETRYFYSPATKSVVKLIARMSKVTTDSSIPDRIEMELMDYGHKEPVVQAPDYEEGNWWAYKVKTGDESNFGSLDPVIQAPVYEERDWWVYRVKRGNATPQEYRIVYRNGEFQGDDPLFVADNTPPLASLFLNHPEVKNFIFPLVPGKKWTFRYSRLQYGITQKHHAINERPMDAEVEVIGPMPEIVETPAGKFKAIEIRRREEEPRVETVYYYSPECKSVVKLTVDSEPGVWGEAVDHIELELIEYGTGAKLVEQPVVKAPVIE